MGIAMLVEGVLTLAAYMFLSEGLDVLAFPGLICGLMVTGGHGGTNAQELIGKVVAVAVNMGIVALPFLLVFWLVPRGLHHGRSPQQGKG